MTGPQAEGVAPAVRTRETSAPAAPAQPVWAMLLGAFAEGDLLVHPAEFAARHRLDKATVYRVCAEMEAAEFFERAATTRTTAYRAGRRVFELAAGALHSNAYEAQRLASEVAGHARFLDRARANFDAVYGAAAAPRPLANQERQEKSA